MTRKTFISTAVLMVTLLSNGILYPKYAVAEDDSTDRNAWQFEITPYLFAAGMDGTVGLRGVSADIDMSFSDIWDHLDSALMA